MKGTWWEGIRDRLRSAWDVLAGHAYAGYVSPEYPGCKRHHQCVVCGIIICDDLPILRHCGKDAIGWDTDWYSACTEDKRRSLGEALK